MGQLLLLIGIFLIASQLSPKVQARPAGRNGLPLPFAPPSPVPVPFPGGVPPRDTWEFIKWIQRSLNTILDSSLTVDGLLGPQTKEAISNFQAQTGLRVDSIPGPITEAEIKKALQFGIIYDD